MAFIEFFLKLGGSVMRRRQRNTAMAGTVPKPRERRHTARRWLSPKLLIQVRLSPLSRTMRPTSSTKPGGRMRQSQSRHRSLYLKHWSCRGRGHKIGEDTYWLQVPTIDAERFLRYPLLLFAPKLTRSHKGILHRCRYRGKS